MPGSWVGAQSLRWAPNVTGEKMQKITCLFRSGLEPRSPSLNRVAISTSVLYTYIR